MAVIRSPRFDAGLRARAAGQDGHHLQPPAEGIEYEPGAIEDLGLTPILLILFQNTPGLACSRRPQ